MGANTKGGDHFRAGRFEDAVKCYSGAIEADADPSELAKLLANRSAAYGRLGNLEAALADGKRAVEIDPSYIKGYFRATKAHMALGQFHQASSTASEGLRRQPDNKDLQQALQDANSEGANSPGPPSGRRAKPAATPASPPSITPPVVPASAAWSTEATPPSRASSVGACTAELVVELEARLADAEARAEECVQFAEAHANVAEAARHGQSALASSQQPTRSPTAPEHPPTPPRPPSPRTQGCLLGPKGEPSPRGCLREAAAAALRCLPIVGDATAYDRLSRWRGSRACVWSRRRAERRHA